MTLTLGLSGLYHDSAACIVSDGEVIAAIQEERLTRKKHDSRFPFRAIDAVLALTDKAPAQLDAIGWYENPRAKSNRIFTTQFAEAPKGIRQFWNVLNSFDPKKNEPGAYLKHSELIDVPIMTFPHHLSHAASAFYLSGFDHAAIMVMDGVGEWATGTIYKGSNTEISYKAQQRFPHSVGLLYATFTAFCGFKVNSGEYKLMGLAPYGRAIYLKKLKEIVRVNEDGSIQLNLTFFDFTRGVEMYSRKLTDVLGFGPRSPEGPITEAHCDLAASIQELLNRVYVASAKYALSLTRSNYLCLAGGVALNCVANNRLLSLLSPSNIFIQPAAGDAGGALGAALLANRAKQMTPDKWKPVPLRHVFLGTTYNDVEIEIVLRQSGLYFKNFDSTEETCDEVVALLCKGLVVGWFQGPAEFGPRALGARSILADPRIPHMQRHLNLAIKNRESFRPFAPAILSEHVSALVDWPQGTESPFMLYTAYLRESQRLPARPYNWPESGHLMDALERVGSAVPAVTHVDYSMRFQSVGPGSPLRKLLAKFYQKTGCPMVVNTSYNVRGEPIVETPIEALTCFAQTAMDAVAIGRFVVVKSAQKADTLIRFTSKKLTFEPD